MSEADELARAIWDVYVDHWLIRTIDAARFIASRYLVGETNTIISNVAESLLAMARAGHGRAH